jgi:hypothetical protein
MMYLPKMGLRNKKFPREVKMLSRFHLYLRTLYQGKN